MSSEQNTPHNLEQIRQHYFKAGDAAKALGMTRDAFNHYADSGLIEGHKILGSHRWFLKSDVQRLARKIEAAVLVADDQEFTFRKATLDDLAAEIHLAYLIFGPRAKSPEAAERRRVFLAANPDMTYHLYHHTNLAASINILPLEHEYIEQFKNGVRGWLFPTNGIKQFVPGKPLECIIIDMMTSPNASPDQRERYALDLLKGIAMQLATWANQGIEIKSVHAAGITDQGRAILRGAGFTELGEPVTGRVIFELDVWNAPLHLLAPYQQALADWQRQHGIEPAPRRAKPPTGYIMLGEARKILGSRLLRNYTKSRRLKRYGRYFKADEVEAIRTAERIFHEVEKEDTTHMDAVFVEAGPGDMDALYAMAVKLFPATADADRRRSWMKKEPRGHYIVKRMSDGAVMAYFYLLPLVQSQLANYLHGDLPSAHIKPEDIEAMESGKPTSACVIGGIGSDPDIDQETRTAYVAVLLRGVRKSMGQLGRDGFIIPTLYAFSETNDGIALCTKLGMPQWEPPTGKRCTFALDMTSARASIIRDYKHGLAEWQVQHPQKAGELKQVALVPRHAPAQSIEKLVTVRSTIPEGCVILRHFNETHGMKDTTILRRINANIINITRGEWQHGKQRVTQVLTPEQQHNYYEALHTEPGFIRCNQCPH